MPKVKMLCMANSRKPKGRCIAGLLPDGSWIRPVSTPNGGAIEETQTVLDIGRPIQPLDIVKIPIRRAVARHHQQENQLIDNRPWRFLSDLSLRDEGIADFFSKHAYDEDTLFGDPDRNMSWEEVKENKINHSLALVRTSHPIFRRLDNRNGQPRFLSNFYYKDYGYRLPITIVGFERQIPAIKVDQMHKSESDWWFTISLGEPFKPQFRNEKFCYKLIAGAIEIL